MAPSDAIAQMTPSGLRVTEAPKPEELHLLERGLAEHSEPFIEAPGFRPLAVFRESSAGVVEGGAYGYVNWDWLHLKLLWVAPANRGRGIGETLLVAIESEAQKRGCRYAHVETFSYQALAFYQTRGYETFGTLAGYPTSDHSKLFLRKVL